MYVDNRASFKYSNLNMVKIQRNLIIATLVISGVACTLCIISISTNNWIDATAELSARLTSEVNYGIFAGSLERQQLVAMLKFNLAVVCDFSRAACIYSCQKSAIQRENELKLILQGLELEPCEQAAARRYNHNFEKNHTSNAIRRQSEQQIQYMPAAFWLGTIVFLILSICFTLCSVGFTLFNLYTSPVQRIFNIFGLYIWNSIAASTALMTLLLWAALFELHLSHNIAITDTLRQELTFSTNGRAKIGSSFYVLLAAMLLDVINIGLLLVRRYIMLCSDAPTTITMSQTDVPLEFY